MSAKKDTFQIGDQVQLISGGPVMTVTDVSEILDRVSCSWFSGKKHESGGFPPGALKRAQAESDDATK